MHPDRRAAARGYCVRHCAGRAGPVAGRPAGLVDGAELYGPISFQDGRFRRIALLPEITARTCRALARGADDQPWFDSGTAPAAPFLLGSPGLADASLQVLQACLPHRRVRFAGCGSVRFSGRTADGAVEIWATAVPGVSAVPLQGAPPAAETVPATAADPGDQPDAAARWRSRSKKARRQQQLPERDQPVPVGQAQAAPSRRELPVRVSAGAAGTGRADRGAALGHRGGGRGRAAAARVARG